MISRMLDIPLAERLAKLVRMLSSDNEGEVVNAAAAIKRVLKENGGDIHTLADLITKPKQSSAKVSQVAVRRAYREGFNDGLRRVGEDEDHESRVLSWREMAKFCKSHSDRLASRERNFVEQMDRWTRLGREPSEKQGRWLDFIYTRLQQTKERNRRHGRKRQS